MKKPQLSQGGDPAPKKLTDEALATLMLDRQERMQRCGKVIDEVLKKERCILNAPIGVTSDGRIVVPQVQVQALD